MHGLSPNNIYFCTKYKINGKYTRNIYSEVCILTLVLPVLQVKFKTWKWTKVYSLPRVSCSSVHNYYCKSCHEHEVETMWLEDHRLPNSITKRNLPRYVTCYEAIVYLKQLRISPWFKKKSLRAWGVNIRKRKQLGNVWCFLAALMNGKW